MSSLWKELEKAANRAQRERERQRKVEVRNSYNNLLQQIENENVNYNNQMEKNLYNLANPQKVYSIIIEDMNEYVNEYYEGLKNELIERKFKPTKPVSLSTFYKNNNVPKKKTIREQFNKELKNKRLELEQEYLKKYNDIYLKKIEKMNKEDKELFDKLLSEENEEIIEHNNNIDLMKENYLNGDKKEIERVLFEMFKNNMSFNIDNDVYTLNNNFNYEPKTRTLNIELIFFSPNVFSKLTKSRRYIKRYNEYKYNYLSENEINKYYESYLMGTALFITKTIAKYFDNSIDYFYLNCYINDINPLIGKKGKILVLSANLNTLDLKKIDIDAINPKEYFKSIKARISKKMASLISIEPLKFLHNDSYDKYSIENINYNLDGFEFEKLSKDLLLSYGFDQVEVTKASGDYGADVIAYKDDIKYAIQCKKYSSKVGVSAIQEVIASKSIYNCHVAVVLTNNYFTPNAIRLANENNVLLWDRDKLIMMIELYKNKNNSN